jgi:alanine racemase
MDSCAIDVTDILRRLGENAVKLGDMVTVLGRDGEESVDAKMLARIDGTIPYEILTSIADRLNRQIV